MSSEVRMASERTAKPPYLSYKTLATLLDGFRASNVPNLIDRSVLPSSMSGANQALALGALRFLGLVDERGEPQQSLHDLVEHTGPAYTDTLRRVVVEAYAFLLTGLNIERATTRQVEEKFREQGLSGETLRKAITFFLFAAKEGGLKVSPHIKPYNSRAPRMPGTRMRKGSGNGGTGDHGDPDDLDDEKPPPGDEKPLDEGRETYRRPRSHGSVNTVLLSDGREAEVYIPDQLKRRDAKRLKGFLANLIGVVDFLVVDEDEPKDEPGEGQEVKP
jgi:hypothetical protein